MTSRPTVLVSIVLALALLGDSLLYAVLPLHAKPFGISLAWVGVLLSANRLIRLFVYPFLPRIASTGLRRFTIAAATIGAFSTLAFSVASGPWMLLASRLVWGVAFGSLSLSTLAYATASHDAGKRVGLSLSLRELGPLLSLTVGAIAVAQIGVRPTLVVLGVASIGGIFVAMRLPDIAIVREESDGRLFRLPRNAEWRSLVVGFVTDGIFPATVGLLIARSSGLLNAVIGTGMLLGFKRIAVVVFAPVSGHAADRFGGDIVTAAGFIISAVGTLCIACGGVVGGAILVSCGAAVTTTSIPISVAAHHARARVAALAGVGMARDAGAAGGPLVALVLFDFAGATVLYSVAAALMAAIGLQILPSLMRAGNDDLRASG
jgi:MFS transporter, DHA1 family, inner membrane transport protein